MLRKVSIFALAAAALALTMAVPANANDAAQVVVTRGEPVQIAFAADLSGSTSRFATSLGNAVQMAVEAHPSIRGFPIQVNVVEPPCGNAAAATSIVSNVQNVAVLGHFCSTGDTAALPIYQAAGVVTISGSTTDPSLPLLGPTVFNSVAVPDGCCPLVDRFSPWYALVQGLPSDLAWRDAYTQRFGSTPTDFADLYYDATSLLVKDLQKTSTLAWGGTLVVDRAALAAAVRGTTKYQGVTCTVALDPATGYRVNDRAALSSCPPAWSLG